MKFTDLTIAKAVGGSSLELTGRVKFAYHRPIW